MTAALRLTKKKGKGACCLLLATGLNGCNEPQILTGRVKEFLMFPQSKADIKMSIPLKQLLEDYLGGNRKETFKITYNDLHGLYGGRRIGIDSAGQVILEIQNPGEALVGKPRNRVPAEGMKRLVQLLLELQVWEQRVPERTVQADESVARLEIETSKGQTRLWEFYNEMETLQRLVKVKNLMLKLARE